MGIQGLTTFVDKRPHLLQGHKLRNCRIVIDGNNFYFFLYYFFHVRLHFGGDYDVYALKVRRVFEHFARCGVQPYVVLDGGDHLDSRKLATQLKRCRDRLRMAWQLARGHRGAVLPVLAFQTFLTVLQDMGIPHAICDFEADDAIAALAARWGCPVMSNDSDFFVYDLKGGLVLFDYADLANPRVDERGEPYIHVELFLAKNFAKFYKIDTRVLPLFATLVGNDHVDKATFLNFINHLPRLKNYGKLSARHALFMKVLDWLKTVENVEAARKYVLSRMGESKTSALEKLLDASITHYSELVSAEGLELMQFFERPVSPEEISSSDQNKHDRKGTPCLSSPPEDSMPQWCNDALRVGKLYPFIKNCYLLGRIILLSHVEDFKCPSVNLTSLHIRQVLYGMLASRGGEAQPSSQQVVMEYDRRGESHNIRRVAVSPIWELPGMGRLPTLAQVPAWSQEDRLGVFAAALGVMPAWLTSLPQEMRLLGAVMVHWTQQSKSGISLLHLQAILVCLLLLQARHELRTRRVAQRQNGAPEESVSVGDTLDPDEDSDDKESDEFIMGHDSDDNSDADDGEEEEISEAFDVQDGTLDTEKYAKETEEEEEEEEEEEKEICAADEISFVKESAFDKDSADGCVTPVAKQETLSTASQIHGSSQPDAARQQGSGGHSESLDGSCACMSETQGPPTKPGLPTDLEKDADPPPHSAAVGSSCGSGEPSSAASSLSPQAACHLVKDEELELLLQRLDKFRSPPPRTRSNPYPEVTVIHSFSELQACLLHATYLSAALQWPVPAPFPQHLLSATFLYSFLLELRRRPKPPAFLRDVLGGLWHVFCSLEELLLAQLPQGALQTAETRQAVRRRRKTAAKSRPVQRHSSPEGSESEAGVMQSVAGCSIANRFSLLALDAD